MESFKIGTEGFAYNVQKGRVVQMDERSKTSVTGEGGGGSMYNGTGVMKGVSISSTTTTYQKIYFVDEQGKQFMADLTDWYISAIKDHEFVLIWLETEKHSNYGVIYNKTLDKVWYSNLQSYFGQWSWQDGCGIVLFGLLALLLLPYFIGKLFGMILGDIVGVLVTNLLYIAIPVITIIICIKHSSGKKKADALAQKLRLKIDQILKANI